MRDEQGVAVELNTLWEVSCCRPVLSTVLSTSLVLFVAHRKQGPISVIIILFKNLFIDLNAIDLLLVVANEG